MNDEVYVFCPPLSLYPEQPKDQSHCELVDCPECSQKMWVSDKKKGMMKFAETLGRKIIILCYPCFMNFCKEHPEIVINGTQVNL